MPDAEVVTDLQGLASGPSGVATRIAVLEAKIAKSSEKTRFDHFSSWASLVISCLTGGFTIYDQMVSKPKEDEHKMFLELSASLSAISKLNQEMATLSQTVKDDATRGGLLSVLSTQKYIHVQTAEMLEKKLRGKPDSPIGAAEYMTFGSEKVAQGSLDDAIGYYARAVQSAKTPIVESDALRLLARTQFARGSAAPLDEARITYDKAYKTIEKHAGFGASANRALILADWALSEAYFGDCAAMEAKTLAFKAQTEAPDVMPPARAQLLAQFKENLRNQGRCPYTALLGP